jgi:hypothetical protein
MAHMRHNGTLGHSWNDLLSILHHAAVELTFSLLASIVTQLKHK